MQWIPDVAVILTVASLLTFFYSFFIMRKTIRRRLKLEEARRARSSSRKAIVFAHNTLRETDPEVARLFTPPPDDVWVSLHEAEAPDTRYEAYVVVRHGTDEYQAVINLHKHPAAESVLRYLAGLKPLPSQKGVGQYGG